MPQTDTINVLQLDTRHPEFSQRLNAHLQSEAVAGERLQAQVAAIIRQVREQGDQGLLECVRRYDGMHAASVADLQVPSSVITDARERLDKPTKEALCMACERIRRYAEKQKLESWQFSDESGSLLGQRITPLHSCGLYVPGGKAAYPSSVLMSAIPAHVAGVPRVLMAIPTSLPEMNMAILAAASLAGR